MLNYTVKYNNMRLPPRLPSEYLEVEYILSTGTLYIDLGYTPNNTTRWELEYLFINLASSTSTDYELGANLQTSNSRFLITAYDNTFRFSLGITSSYTPTVDTNKHLFIIDAYSSLVGLDDNLVAHSHDAISMNKTILLFALNDKEISARYKHNAKLYSCKFYENNSIIINLIPCYRKSDNIIGLYDIVNNQFYTNSGTGAFLKGNDIDCIYSSLEPVASVPIKYNNETKATLTTPTTIILPTKDKYCNSNILIGNIILPTNNKCMRDNILVDTVHAIHLVTSAEILAAIKLYRGSYSFSVLTDLVLGSSGLSITGVTTRAVGATTYYGDNGCMVLPIDLSQYSSVSYYAKKGANHGCLSVGITDSIPTTSTVYNATLLNSIGYGSFSTDWVKYTHDLSSYSGTKYLIFAGGYADKTGSTSSNTLYCNIIFD